MEMELHKTRNTAAPGKASAVNYFHSIFSLRNTLQRGTIYSHVVQTSAAVTCKKQGLGMLSICRALSFAWVLSLGLHQAGASRWVLRGREKLTKEAEGCETQQQALCAGWNASHGDQCPQKQPPATPPPQAVECGGVQVPREHSTQAHLTCQHSMVPLPGRLPSLQSGWSRS